MVKQVKQRQKVLDENSAAFVVCIIHIILISVQQKCPKFKDLNRAMVL